MNVCLMLPAASRRRCNDNRSCRAFCGTCYFAARFAECADAAALPLGLVARAQRAHIGEPALTEGSTIYCGDYVSTEDGGSVLIRIGESSLELQSASAAISRVSQPQTLRAGSAGQRSFADCCRPKPVHAGDTGPPGMRLLHPRAGARGSLVVWFVLLRKTLMTSPSTMHSPLRMRRASASRSAAST